MSLLLNYKHDLSDMSKQRLQMLADHVEKEYVPFNGIKAVFDMANWLASTEITLTALPLSRTNRLTEEQVHSCNTVACLAGFACLIFDYELAKEKVSEIVEAPKFSDRSVYANARDLLFLTNGAADQLFTGYTSQNVTGPQAAYVIREFVRTGYIDWRPIHQEHSGYQTFSEVAPTLTTERSSAHSQLLEDYKYHRPGVEINSTWQFLAKTPYSKKPEEWYIWDITHPAPHDHGKPFRRYELRSNINLSNHIQVDEPLNEEQFEQFFRACQFYVSAN